MPDTEVMQSVWETDFDVHVVNIHTTSLTKTFLLGTKKKRNRNGPQLYTEKYGAIIAKPLYHDSVHFLIRSLSETTIYHLCLL